MATPRGTRGAARAGVRAVVGVLLIGLILAWAPDGPAAAIPPATVSAATSAATAGVGPAAVAPFVRVPTASPATKVKRKKRAPLYRRVEFGAWVDGMVAAPELLAQRERQVGARFDIASYFYGYGDWFPTSLDRELSDGGRRTILISWDMGPHRFSDWSSGRHDSYLRRIGALAAAYPYDIYVRPWAEMNGDWQPYQPTAAGEKPQGGTPREFIAAWRHVVSTVRAAGGTRIQWVFNPYAATYAETTPVRSIWPGRRYVDVLGMDGYNWGGGPAPWQSFTRVFSPMYKRLANLDRRLPIWICEVGSREPRVDDGARVLPGRGKATWVRRMLTTRKFPRLEAVVWFDEDKERDWRLDSSPGSLATFSKYLGR